MPRKKSRIEGEFQARLNEDHRFMVTVILTFAIGLLVITGIDGWQRSQSPTIDPAQQETRINQ